MSPAARIALVVALSASAAASPQGAPGLERQLQALAFGAITRCISTRRQADCSEADTALQHLIRSSEQPHAQQQRPRCLGALTQLETHLAAVRWRLERTSDLAIQLEEAQQDCPAAPSGGMGQ